MVGQFVTDIIVEATEILELKSVQCTAWTHEVQLVNGLVANGREIG